MKAACPEVFRLETFCQDLLCWEVVSQVVCQVMCRAVSQVVCLAVCLLAAACPMMPIRNMELEAAGGDLKAGADEAKLAKGGVKGAGGGGGGSGYVACDEAAGTSPVSISPSSSGGARLRSPATERVGS